IFQDLISPCVMSTGIEKDGEEGADPNVIRMIVENVKDLTMDGVQPFTKRISVYPWSLNVIRYRPGQLTVFADCMKSEESAMW
ncbi:hypothetical protein PENTCL1PPCAC_23593, partial [Pristionchus entomophagus]